MSPFPSIRAASEDAAAMSARTMWLFARASLSSDSPRSASAFAGHHRKSCFQLLVSALRFSI